MSNVSKRVMTLKSVIGFGKYESLTIQRIVDMGKLSYLRWVYFSYEKIDFVEEILELLGIDKKYRLVKPAKNLNFLKITDNKAKDENKFIPLNTEEAIEKRKKVYRTFKTKNVLIESKSSLLRRNHGHKN